MPDTEHETRRAIEAVLMVAEMPVEPQLLAQLLELPVARVTELCEAMAAEYEAEGRGFALVPVAGGWRFQSHADLAPYVERFVLEGQSARLSAAALETLAIVAYKQPVSRAQVAAIRGVERRRRDPHAPAARLHRRGRQGSRARARRSCSAPRRCSSSGSASTALDQLPPLERVRARRRRGGAPRVGPAAAARAHAQRAARRDRGGQRRAARRRAAWRSASTRSTSTTSTTTRSRRRCPTRATASASRRCWPRPGSAAAGPART